MLANAIFIANAGKQQLNLTDVGRRNVLSQVKADAAVLSSNEKIAKASIGKRSKSFAVSLWLKESRTAAVRREALAMLLDT